jgi:murein endopeptidase
MRASLLPCALALLGALLLLRPPPPAARPSALKSHDPEASCSAGSRSEGRLLHGTRIPERGHGFRRLFPHRREAYGTDELVAAVLRVAAQLARRDPAGETPAAPEPLLGVGNLTAPEAERFEADPFLGRAFSRAHASGRAVDLAFFVGDRSGRPVDNEETGIAYRRDGWNEAGHRRLYRPEAAGRAGPGCKPGRTSGGLREWKCFVPAETRRFDDGRNWALVRAFLLDPVVGVIDPATGRVRPKDRGIRRILISNGLRERLLAEASRRRELPAFIEVAAAVMTQPSNAPAHDDHLHIDLNCEPEDIERCGCRNTGVPPRPRAGQRLFPPAEAP